jgi:hypothetical protein
MMIDAGGTAGPQEVYPVRHWLVTNIPGASLAKGDISAGLVGEPFHSPGPPSGSHYHRCKYTNNPHNLPLNARQLNIPYLHQWAQTCPLIGFEWTLATDNPLRCPGSSLI